MSSLRLHRWFGLLLAAYVLLISVSGALLLFSNEYLQWLYPELQPELNLAALARVTTDSVDPITAIVLPTQGRPALQIYHASGVQCLADPATGTALDDCRWHESVPAFLFDLHVHLLAGDLGQTVAGVLGLVLLVSFGTGLKLFLRRRKHRFLRRLVPRDLGRTALTRAHAGQGAVALPLLLLLVLTGVGMVFPQTTRALLVGLLGSNGPTRPLQAEPMPVVRAIDWPAQLAAAQQSMPEAEIRMLLPARQAGEPLLIRLKNRGELHPNGRSYIALHPGTAEVLDRIDATQIGLGPELFNLFYPLHSGKTGWPGHRWLLLAVSLSLCFMACAGLRIAWLKRSWSAAARADSATPSGSGLVPRHESGTSTPDC